MTTEEITPAEAHAQLQLGALYIDVRTPEEFEEGHPAGAYNLPLQLRDAHRGLVDNPAFVSHVRALFTADRTLILGCRAGPRAVRAAALLRAQGYRALSVMRGGMEGKRDAFGALEIPGWKQAGLPVSYDHERTYAALTQRIA